MGLESLSKILSINLKRNFLPHFFIAIAITLLTPVVFGISSLEKNLAAQPLEMLLSLTGTVLLTPIFLPEQNECIRDVIRSKRTNYLTVCIIRVLYSIVFLAGIFGCFAAVMYFSESDITLAHFTGGLASALFLGSVGFAAAGISSNTTVGYMVSVIYYIANFGLKGKLGKLFLFSMSADDFEPKYLIIILSVVLVVCTFLYLKFVKRM